MRTPSGEHVVDEMHAVDPVAREAAPMLIRALGC
jgi:hypothetical protein